MVIEQLVDVVVERTAERDHQTELKLKSNTRSALHRKQSRRSDRALLATKRKHGDLPRNAGNVRGHRSEMKECVYKDRTLGGELTGDRVLSLLHARVARTCCTRVLSGECGCV